MLRSYDGQEVWFVTGSQTMYGEETLRRSPNSPGVSWPDCRGCRSGSSGDPSSPTPTASAGSPWT